MSLIIKYKRGRKGCECKRVKEATWTLPGHLYAEYCKQCKPSHAFNMAPDCRRCKCVLRKCATFGPKGGKRSWCDNCPDKPADAVDLVNLKKCECGAGQPSKGLLSEGVLRWCAKCPSASSAAVNLKKDRCECQIALASFGYETNMKARWCKECKPSDAVDVMTRPSCICGKPKRFGLRNSTKAEWCYDCSPKDGSAIYIGKKYCLTSLCYTRADNPLYRGYCVRCFVYTFPDEPITRNYKTKESLAVAKIKEVTSEYSHLVVTFDKVLGGCSRRRPDIFIDCLTHVIVMEHDENGHRDRECEEKRILEIFQDAGNRPLVALRMNPDSYRDNSGVRVPSCFTVNASGSLKFANEDDWNQRMNAWCDRLRFHLQNIPSKEITMEFLFYDQ